MATRAEIRAQRREERRAERTQERQAARQATAGGGLLSGIGARMQQRQTARQARKMEKIGARTTRIGSRQTERSARTQSKAEGGYFDPESVGARWGALSDVAGTIGDVYTGGVSSMAGDALSAMSGGLALDEGGELVELYPDEAEGMGYLVPALIAGAVVGGYFLLRKPKDKKGKK